MSNDIFLIVYSAVDDAGLDASEFRVICHLSRRQNEKRAGYAWPGKASIAKTCRLNEKTVERVLKDLLAWNVITEDRSQTHQGAGVYRKVNHPAMWQIPVRTPHPKGDPGARNGGGSKEAPGGRVKEAPGGGPKGSPPKGIHTRLSKKEIQYTLPILLNTSAFKTAYDRWLEHLRLKDKSPTSLAVEEQLKKCESLGEQRAIAMISHSIGSGYQGLYEEKAGGADGRKEFTAPSRKLEPPVDYHRHVDELIHSFNKYDELPSPGDQKVFAAMAREKKRYILLGGEPARARLKAELKPWAVEFLNNIWGAAQ